MNTRKSPAKVTARQRRLLELQVREHIERYHPEMANSTISISPDSLIAGVSVKPAKSVPSRRKR